MNKCRKSTKDEQEEPRKAPKKKQEAQGAFKREMKSQRPPKMEQQRTAAARETKQEIQEHPTWIRKVN